MLGLKLLCSPWVLAHAWVHLAVQAWVLLAVARVLQAGVTTLAIGVVALLGVGAALIAAATRQAALSGVQQQLQDAQHGTTVKTSRCRVSTCATCDTCPDVWQIHSSR